LICCPCLLVRPAFMMKRMPVLTLAPAAAGDRSGVPAM
jgi:hypothetical protein